MGDGVPDIGYQIADVVEVEAERAGMPFVSNRWLGGTLTNFSTIQPQIANYQKLADSMAQDHIGTDLTKRERMMLTKEYERLHRFYGGLRIMKRLPGLLFVVDPTMEENAIAEARRLHIPIIAMCDTNSDPDVIDFPIPSNDDAIRAIQLMTGRVADAVLEGIAVGEVEQQFQAQAAPGAAEAAAPAEAAAEPAAEAPAENA